MQLAKHEVLEDVVTRRLETNREFSLKSAYDFLKKEQNLEEPCEDREAWIWKVKSCTKILVFCMEMLLR